MPPFRSPTVQPRIKWDGIFLEKAVFLVEFLALKRRRQEDRQVLWSSQPVKAVPEE